MKVVVFLQNAWSPRYAGKVWPRKSWLCALAKSRSGQRLTNLIDDFDLCENTTLHVGSTASSIIEPDENHIISVLQERKPDIIIACGIQATKALTLVWNGPLISVPHPAHRLVTNALYHEARAYIETGAFGRVRFRQMKGKIIREEIKL